MCVTVKSAQTHTHAFLQHKLRPLSHSQSTASVRSHGVLLFEVRRAELPPHPGRRVEAPHARRRTHPHEDFRREGRGSSARQTVEVGVGPRLEWWVLEVVVGVVLELMVLALIIERWKAPVSVPVYCPPSARNGRRPPPLSGSSLVAAVGPAPTLLVVVVAALRGTVQGVSAVTPLVVLVVALLVVEVPLVAMVTLLPGTLRAGRAHARGRHWEGEGQHSRLTLGG